MKMRNEDVKKITEIKQYLLDPPVSFRLYDYALVYVQDAINVLTAYNDAADTNTYLKNLLEELNSKIISQENLRETLIQAGIKLSKLTSK